MKKRTKQSECPAELGALLEVLNDLPGTREKFESVIEALTGGSDQVDQLFVEWVVADEEGEVGEAEERLRRYTEAHEAHERLLDSDLKLRHPALVRYGAAHTSRSGRSLVSRLFDEREMLVSVIEAGERWRESGRDPGGIYKLSTPVVSIGFDAGGLPIVAGLRVLEIIHRNKIPVERLLVCPVCGKMAWKKKKDAQTCGGKNCSDTLGNMKRSKKYKSAARVTRDIWETGKD